MTAIAREETARAILQADPSQAQHWFEYIEALIQASKDDEARRFIALARRKGLAGPKIDALEASTQKPAGARTVLPALANEVSENPLWSGNPADCGGLRLRLYPECGVGVVGQRSPSTI